MDTARVRVLVRSALHASGEVVDLVETLATELVRLGEAELAPETPLTAELAETAEAPAPEVTAQSTPETATAPEGEKR